MTDFLIPSIATEQRSADIIQKSKLLFAQKVAEVAGLKAIQDASAVPLGRSDLSPYIAKIEKLMRSGIATDWGQPQQFPDEPPIRSWWIQILKEKAGGLSTDSDEVALRAAISEALERHIWKHETDYFRKAVCASFRELGEKHAIHPSRFAGYSEQQRKSSERLLINEESEILWIQGYSLTRKKKILVPTQIVSRHHAVAAMKDESEPFIREPITTGLATHPDRTQALLSGALEIIERDAYVIMWLNKLSLPRIAHQSLGNEYNDLAKLLQKCRRYNLDVHFVRLITDAPAYAIMAVVRDPRMMPPVSVGICANTRASLAAEKALLEALRARKNTRWLMKKHGPISKDPQRLAFVDRHRYWADISRSHLLDFLTAGPTTPLQKEAWETDGPAEHLQRTIDWCAKAGYELCYVDFSISKKNVLGLNVVFVVIPELQPIYLTERWRCEGGDRLSSVPQRFGLTSLKEVFVEEPHPFV